MAGKLARVVALTPVFLLGLDGCATRATTAATSALTGAPACEEGGTGPPAPDPTVAGRVVGFVVEETPTELRIASYNEFSAGELGDRSTWNGQAESSHRWRLFDRCGKTLDSGDIGVNLVRHTPPSPGYAPVNLPRYPLVFVVRTPAPGPGQRIEISSLMAGIRPVRWQRDQDRAAADPRREPNGDRRK